jgi:hypothetical protein
VILFFLKTPFIFFWSLDSDSQKSPYGGNQILKAQSLPSIGLDQGSVKTPVWRPLTPFKFPDGMDPSEGEVEDGGTVPRLKVKDENGQKPLSNSRP